MGSWCKMFKKIARIVRKFRAGFFRGMAEKRKYTRVPLSVKVTYLNSGSFSYYHASNISIGGMFIKANEPLPVGSPLALKDPYPSGMGLRFTEISKEARRAVEAFVNMKT
jgi:hypothetical protein